MTYQTLPRAKDSFAGKTLGTELHLFLSSFRLGDLVIPGDKQLGEKLLAKRRQLNITRTDLAVQMNVNPLWYTLLEASCIPREQLDQEAEIITAIKAHLGIE